MLWYVDLRIVHSLLCAMRHGHVYHRQCQYSQANEYHCGGTKFNRSHQPLSSLYQPRIYDNELGVKKKVAIVKKIIARYNHTICVLDICMCFCCSADSKFLGLVLVLYNCSLGT